MPSQKKPQKTPTTDAAVAEVAPNEFQLVFKWRDHVFAIDPQDFEFGRAMFAVRLATNEKRGFGNQLNSMIDAFEAIVGQEQLEVAVRLEPHLFDDPEAVKSFFGAITQSVTGGSLGE